MKMCMTLALSACCWFLLTLGVNLPPSYGKTQFIIGVTEKELRAQTSNMQAGGQHNISSVHLDDSQNTHVFFSPDDNVTGLLLELIAGERKYILMAAYMITDKQVAQALVQAHARGVRVEVIIDACCLKSHAGKIELLREGFVPLHVYNGVVAKPTMSNIMHNKFIIFGSNIHDKSLVWTGSFNFTHSAQHYNQENIVILSDKLIVKRFKRQFEVLKKRCNCLSAKHPFDKKVQTHNHKKNFDRLPKTAHRNKSQCKSVNA